MANDGEVSKATLKRVERILRADIRWTIEKGPGWNPGAGARKNGKWHGPMIGWKECGVCAIGALCVRRQPEAVRRHGFVSDVATAAKVLGLPYQWTSDLYVSVMLNHKPPHCYLTQVAKLAARLRRYGDRLNDKKRAG